MVLLSDQPAYGYQLLGRLAPFELDRDRGRVYRILRDLEVEGIVSSGWTGSDIGPARHMYELTPSGAAALRDAVQALQASAGLIERVLDVYRVSESRRLWLRDHPPS
jgi:PadR family transcriptional regulator PadR